MKAFFFPPQLFFEMYKPVCSCPHFLTWKPQMHSKHHRIKNSTHKWKCQRLRTDHSSSPGTPLGSLISPLQSVPQSTATPWMQCRHCLWVHVNCKCRRASLLSNRSHSLQGSRTKWPLKVLSNSNGSTILCVYLKCFASGKINEIT